MHNNLTLTQVSVKISLTSFSANQQTITELVGFVKRISPETASKSTKQPTKAGADQKESSESIDKVNISSSRIT